MGINLARMFKTKKSFPLFMQYGCYLTGAFGQSQKLYAVRNEAKRGRDSESKVAEQIRKDTELMVQAQLEAGLDWIIDPLFAQYDLFQPLAEGVPGIRVGRQENWFNNNLFNGRLHIDGRQLQHLTGWSAKFLHPELLSKEGKWMGILPSPYTILALSDISGYQDKKSGVRDLAELVKAEANHLASLGAGRIQYDEPVIVQKQSLGCLEKEDLELLQIAMSICGTILNTSTSLNTYFGDAAPLLSYLRDLPVDCLGIDGTETNLQPILQEKFPGKEIALGLIDARSSNPEEPEELSRIMQEVAEHCQPKRLWLTPNTATEYNGPTHAFKKIEILKESKRLSHG